MGKILGNIFIGLVIVVFFAQLLGCMAFLLTCMRCFAQIPVWFFLVSALWGIGNIFILLNVVENI